MKHIAFYLLTSVAVLTSCSAKNDTIITEPIETSVTGTVTDAITGTPLSGASVEVSFSENGTVRGIAAMTNADGEFCAYTGAPAKYTLKITLQGYTSGIIYFDLTKIYKADTAVKLIPEETPELPGNEQETIPGSRSPMPGSE